MEYLEVVIAGIAAWLVGVPWYTALFGKAWREETGISEDDARSGAALTHGLALVMMIIIAYAINFIVNLHPIEEQTFAHGALHGAMSAGLYALPLVAINYLYQKKSLKLFLIDGAYALVFFAVAGGVCAALKLGGA